MKEDRTRGGWWGAQVTKNRSGPQGYCVVESQGGEGFCLTCWTSKEGFLRWISALLRRTDIKAHTASWMLNAKLHTPQHTSDVRIVQTLQSQQQRLQQLLRSAGGQRGVMQRLAALA